MNFILKIVEGPNKGAEIALVEGVAVTLGKGEDCDVVLADTTLPGEPLMIEASESGVSVGGKALEPLNVMTVGATSFAVGPADAPWGELVWPKAEVPEKPESADKPEKSEKPEKTEKPESPEPPAKRPAKKRRGCIGCLVVLLLLLLALAALAWFFREDPRVETVKSKAVEMYEAAMSRFAGKSGDSAKAGDAEVRSPAETLAALASDYGLELSGSDGDFSLFGNLKTRRDRLLVTAEAYRAMPGISLDLSDDESFRTAAEDALFTLSEGALRVAAATNRALSIVGSSRSPMSLKKTLSALNDDLPKLCGVDVSGVVVGVVAAPADGAADGEGEASQPPARTQRRAARKDAKPLPVCGILTTPYPCIVMRDGRRLMEGAAIGDSVIAEIGADSITLTNSTGRFTWRP